MKIKHIALFVILCLSSTAFAQQSVGSFSRYRRQTSTPKSPPVGFVSSFVRDSDGHMCTVDDAGTVVDLASGGGGFSIATNQICFATGTNTPGGAATLTYTPTNATSGHVGPLYVATTGSSANGVGITLDASSDTNGHEWNIEAQGSAAPATNTSQGDLIWYDTTASKVLLDLDTSGDLTPGNTNRNQTLGDSSRYWFGINAVRHVGLEQTIAAASTITLGPNSGEQIRVTLSATGITTINGSSGAAGETITACFIQDSSGSRTYTGFASGTNGFVFANSSSSPHATAANARDCFTWKWDTVASKWYETSRSAAVL